MQGDVLSSAHPHAQLEPFETIPAPEPFPVDRPPFPPQEDPDSQIAESGAGMGQIMNAQSQRGLILGLTLPIPGCAPELGEPTGPRTTHLKYLVKPLGQCTALGGP